MSSGVIDSIVLSADHVIRYRLFNSQIIIGWNMYSQNGHCTLATRVSVLTEGG